LSVSCVFILFFVCLSRFYIIIIIIIIIIYKGYMYMPCVYQSGHCSADYAYCIYLGSSDT